MRVRLIICFMISMFIAGCAYAPSGMYTDAIATSPDPRFPASINRNPLGGEYQLNLGNYDLRTNGYEVQDGAKVAFDRIVAVYNLGPSIAYVIEGESQRCGRRDYIFDMPKVKSARGLGSFPPFGQCGVKYQFAQAGSAVVGTEVGGADPLVISYAFGRYYPPQRLSEIRRRHEAEAQAQHQREEAAAARDRLSAKYQPIINSLISTDAKGWISNRYDVGSAKDLQFITEGSRVIGVRTDYTYNGGQPGWVRIDMRQSPPCLEYWDARGVCRAPDPQRAARIGALLGAMAAAYSKSQPAAASTSPPNAADEIIKYNVWNCGLEHALEGCD